MAQKIAIAIVHGIGKQEPDFASKHIKCLGKELKKELKGDYRDDQFVCEPVYWQPCLQADEDELWRKLKRGGELNSHLLRRFFIDFAADAVAYQPAVASDQTYQDIHKVFAGALRELARRAAADAPLCIIAHSLGTVIASNYVWDLQTEYGRGKPIIRNSVKASISNTPLEHGDTIASFYTLGSPLAVWSLRYAGFGTPIAIPSSSFGNRYPGARSEWLNFYDRDDIIGYPLRTINNSYRAAVTADLQVAVGNILTGWNPAAHIGYWDDSDVYKPIAKSLARLWRDVN